LFTNSSRRSITHHSLITRATVCVKQEMTSNALISVCLSEEILPFAVVPSCFQSGNNLVTIRMIYPKDLKKYISFRIDVTSKKQLSMFHGTLSFPHPPLIICNVRLSCAHHTRSGTYPVACVMYKGFHPWCKAATS
jgi:hypothetical protein